MPLTASEAPNEAQLLDSLTSDERATIARLLQSDHVGSAAVTRSELPPTAKTVFDQYFAATSPDTGVEARQLTVHGRPLLLVYARDPWRDSDTMPGFGLFTLFSVDGIALASGNVDSASQNAVRWDEPRLTAAETSRRTSASERPSSQRAPEREQPRGPR